MNVRTWLSERAGVPSAFIDEAKRVVGKDNVSTKECDLIAYSLDYWMYGVFLSQYGSLPSLPSVVISPGNREEIQGILKSANEYKVQITPFGGGSGVLGGAIPINGSAILNLQRMNRFVSLDEMSLVAEFESGIIGANLERELNHRGYSMGNIPQSLYCSTLGGWISTRAVGQFSTKYGKIEDMVLGMEVVLPDGSLLNIRPVPRRSTGPSLKDLLLGGEGTLGIVTRAAVSVHPLPQQSLQQAANERGLALDTVAHLASLYGSRFSQVLDILNRNPKGAQRLCPHCQDIVAQVQHAVEQEGALTIEDFLLRRSAIGLSPCQGLDALNSVASEMGRLLRWSYTEQQRQEDAYRSQAALGQRFRSAGLA